MSPARVRVGLLFGGASVEHEVSVISARGVAAALDEARYEAIPLGITGEGRWLVPEASRSVLASSRARVEPPDPDDGARILVAPGEGLFATVPRMAPVPLPVDVVFTVVHGWGGEDGRIQGLLDVGGVPYVGAGVLGSAAGMDKVIAKEVFAARGLPVTPWVALTRDDYRRDPTSAIESVRSGLGFPVFVKPANGGSSVGITKVERDVALPEALDRAFAHDRRAVVERGLDVREVEVAVLGNASPDASVPGEIIPSREFYDYASKYLDGTSTLIIPADLEPPATARVRALAVEAFRALDLAGLARVDFFVERGTGRVFLNEVNTLPGFTPISMYPKLWEASGIAYPDLLDRLIRLALERATSDRERASRWEGHGG